MGGTRGLDVARPSRVVSGVLHPIQPPSSFVVASNSWPSSLIALQSLDLPVEGAYFPAAYHDLVKAKRHRYSPWCSPCDFTLSLKRGVVYLVSGTPGFVSKCVTALGPSAPIVAHVEVRARGLSLKCLKQSLLAARNLVKDLGLVPTIWWDEMFGGATTSRFVFGVSHELAAEGPPTVIPSLPRDLGNFLCGKSGHYGMPLVDQGSLPTFSEVPAARKAIWHENVLLPRGLLPCHKPQSRVYCPSVFHPGKFGVRPLALQELLRLYQLPLSMDSAIRDRHFNLQHALPFESAPPPDMFVSFFRQLWSGDTGGVEI